MNTPSIDATLCLTRTPSHIAELDRLGEEIAELSAHLDAATARLLDLIREFDAREGWNNGFRSCAAWLVWKVGLDPGAARERVRVARALGTLPLLAEALARGELSYAKVRALTRVATPETFQLERAATFPRRRPAWPSRPWPSSRLMPWHCSPRRASTTASIPARRRSATRSWSMSMPRCWVTWRRRASRSSRTGYAFQLERLSAWRATRLG